MVPDNHKISAEIEACLSPNLRGGPDQLVNTSENTEGIFEYTQGPHSPNLQPATTALYNKGGWVRVVQSTTLNYV